MSSNATALRFPAGPIIRAERERKCLTIEEVAVKIGASASSLANNERGTHQPRERVLYGLARELGLDVEDLRNAS
jgi:transcriptional regulator with XRE-family HTH domain